MPKAKGSLINYSRLALLAVITAALVYFVSRDINKFWHIFLAVLGFSVVVFVHECGHFIVAKLSDINVETFSIFLPPVLLSVRKTADGFRFRILPKFFPKENQPEGDGLLSFTLGKKGKAGETEYCIGLIPFGGFVKMLGQEDTKTVEKSGDPRSYANKPVGIRMAVIAAGVTFNAVSAIIIFMMVFLIGINRIPAVVGGVRPGSPACRAGLKAGDEIIEIAGKSKNLEFTTVTMAAGLSGKDEKIALKVRHEDGSIEDFALVAEPMESSMGTMRLFGILAPQSLTIANVSDSNELLEKTDLLAGDQIKAVNGRDVQTYREFEEIVQNSIVPAVTVTAERAGVSGKSEVESKIKLSLVAADIKGQPESETGHIYSMMPRLKIEAVSKKPPSPKEKLICLFSGRKNDKDIDTAGQLQSGDIILAAGNVENPTYKELRDVTTEYENEKLPITVLRVDSDGLEQQLTITVTPKRSKDDDRVVIGIFLVPVFDAEHPIVAKTISVQDGPQRLEIPRGASIRAVNGVSVSNFYDIVRQIKRNVGQRITIDYRLGDGTSGDVALDIGTSEDFITVQSIPAEVVPFKLLERLYKAEGPVDAIGMGCRKAVTFIVQTYVSLQRVISGLVSPKSFMGPVGIAKASYDIVKNYPSIYYVYWIGLISVLIGAFNSLPVLPFDGGHIVFLLVEKIKGSPVSERVQGIILYIGLVLVLAFVLYITFNDIVRSFF
jgi:regulator of sigma E protease